MLLESVEKEKPFAEMIVYGQICFSPPYFYTPEAYGGVQGRV
jgi:hypothetical protein